MISVITIFLNAEAYLPAAIESVLAQTYPHWELLLVDDGSSDNSLAIATGYAQQFPERIRVLQHPRGENRGMSASRNLGLRHSRGEYIALLDADDVYLPQKLAHQAALLEAHPQAGLIYGTTLYWWSWTGLPADAARDRPRTIGVPAGRLYPPPELFVAFAQDRARTPPTCSVLIRRAAIERSGGFEERFRGMYEDQVFFYKLCLHNSTYVDAQVGDRYRQHPQSHVQRQLQSGAWHPSSRPTPTRQQFLEWLEAYCQEQGVTDRRVWRALRRNLLPYRHPALHRLLSPVESGTEFALRVLKRLARA